MEPDNDVQSGLPEARPRRRVPIITVVLMAVTVICPIVPVVMSLFGWQGDIGPAVFAQPVLGLVGSIAALLHRSIEFSVRALWATSSLALGVILVLVWVFIAFRFFGP